MNDLCSKLSWWSDIMTMIDFIKITRDWFTNKHKQMQVLYARDYLSRTINIYWKIKDKFLKDTDDCWMIYSQ